MILNDMEQDIYRWQRKWFNSESERNLERRLNSLIKRNQLPLEEWPQFDRIEFAAITDELDHRRPQS